MLTSVLMSRLEDAFDLTFDVYAGISDPVVSDAEATIREAARKYANGITIQWCVNHEQRAAWMSGTDVAIPDTCYRGVGSGCVIEPRLLAVLGVTEDE